MPERPTLPRGPRPTRVFGASDVRALLTPTSACAAIADALREELEGLTIPASVIGTHVDRGGFHVKTAGLRRSPPYFAVKVNANFPRDPTARGLPTIQGVLALFDAGSGELVALMDSTELTALRTAATSALAATYLAPVDASTATIIGCGVQGLYHARALATVRPIRAMTFVDASRAAAERLADIVAREIGVAVSVSDDAGEAARRAHIVVTCTTATAPVLREGDLPRPGFVAAVGADSEHKQELSVGALAGSAVVVDVLDQCAAIGELHHALAAGVMQRNDVRATLPEVVAGRASGRFRDDETVVFDSTGTALQDVACAALVLELAARDGGGTTVELLR